MHPVLTSNLSRVSVSSVSVLIIRLYQSNACDVAGANVPRYVQSDVRVMDNRYVNPWLTIVTCNEKVREINLLTALCKSTGIYCKTQGNNEASHQMCWTLREVRRRCDMTTVPREVCRTSRVRYRDNGAMMTTAHARGGNYDRQRQKA